MNGKQVEGKPRRSRATRQAWWRRRDPPEQGTLSLIYFSRSEKTDGTRSGKLLEECPSDYK